MTSDYLSIKSLFYDDKSILEGMKELGDKDKNLQYKAIRAIWESYVAETHGNKHQINLDLAQSRDLCDGLIEYDRRELVKNFKKHIEQMNSHTDLTDEARTEKTAKSVLEDGTIKHLRESLIIDGSGFKPTHLAVIDRALNSDCKDEEKKELRKKVLEYLPEKVQCTSREWTDAQYKSRFDCDGRNAQLYIINMICQGEEFPNTYIDNILTTSGKTKLFDKSTRWESVFGEQNPLHVAWLLSTWKQQTVTEERTIPLPDQIYQEDAVEKFRTMVLQSNALDFDKGKFVQKEHSNILRNLTIIERFFDPDFDVDFSTEEGLSNVYKLAKAMKELLDTYSKDDVICNFLKTIRGPQDPRTFEQRSLPDVNSDNQNRILQALRSNPSGLSSNELREQAGIKRLNLSEIKSYIDIVDDGYILKEEFRPPFKGLSVYIHEKLTGKNFVQHIFDHPDTIELSSYNFSNYIELVKDFDMFSGFDSEYVMEIRNANFLSLRSKFKDYLVKVMKLPDEVQGREKVKKLREILWIKNPFDLSFSRIERHHEDMLEWTKVCMEIHADNDIANIDYRTYGEVWNYKWGERLFTEYSENYLSKVARFVLDQ